MAVASGIGVIVAVAGTTAVKVAVAVGASPSVGVAVSVTVRVAAAVPAAVAVAVRLVSVGVGLVGVDPVAVAATVPVGVAAGQPANALLTARMSWTIVTWPSGSVKAAQAVPACRPSAMLTPMISSLISIDPLPLQSPTHSALADGAASMHSAAAAAAPSNALHGDATETPR